MAHDCFLSYASADVTTAEALYSLLTAEGFSVWFDKARLQPGFDWHREIEVACEASRIVLPILTPRWSRSEWTKYETYGAEAIIPLIAEGGFEDVATPPLRRVQASAITLGAGQIDAPGLVAAIRARLAKRLDSRYESGERSGAWLKMRVNRGQGFVIGGYTIGGDTFDALIFGYYTEPGLMYAARTRNGFTPRVRAELMKRFKALTLAKCPFINVPEKKAGRWGAGLMAQKMVDCRWLKPQLVGQFEFLKWTGDNHLRHSRFVALRDDKNAEDVRREP